jgi:hypothetical protein
MNSADVLPPEDHAEFERVLDEALRTARLTSGADRYHAEQLRALALRAVGPIAAAADSEYRHFVQLRQELRRPDPRQAAAASRAARISSSAEPDPGSGSGLIAMVTVLVPVLAAISAVIFLSLGYVLGLTDPEPAMAEPMREVGWVFAAAAALGVLAAVAVLLVAAIRNGSQTSIRAPRPAAGRGPLAEEVARAREEWRRALLDHGIMPFLREHAGDLGDGSERRTPRLRFSSPDFSSPDFGSPASSQGQQPSATPRYSHPDFSGPRFGSPRFTSPEEGREAAHEAGEAHGAREEPAARRGFASPDFDSGDFASGDFTSGDFDTGADDDARRGPRRGPRYSHPDFSSPEFTSPADGGADRD